MRVPIIFWSFAVLNILACQPDLNRQPKLKPFIASDFFANESSARESVPGTIPFLKKPVVPPPITKEGLLRGQERYDINCSMCHGYSGHGDGMAVRRGFPAPPDFHLLESLPAQAIFIIISSGTVDMPSFSAKISEEDRWRIAQYVKALQLSQNFPKKLLTSSDQEHLNEVSP